MQRVPAADEVGAPQCIVVGEVLLDYDVGRGPVEVQGCTEGDGADRAVGGHPHVLRLSQRGDFLADPQSAAVCHVRLDDIARAERGQPGEFFQHVEPFPGREPTPRYLEEVLGAIRGSSAVALFSEPQLDPRPARVIAQQASVPLFELDPIGGTGATTSYEALLRGNADVLERALR